MFFDPARINVVREMILANDTPGRQKALDKLLVFQREDFRGAPARALARAYTRVCSEGKAAIMQAFSAPWTACPW